MTGKPLPDWSIEAISEASMRTWCTLLRDNNPIHLDPVVAEALGFGPATVNPGPANLSYLVNMMMQAMPDADIAEIDAQFVGHAVAGDTVRALGAPVAGQPGSYDAMLARGDTPLVSARITLAGPQR